MPTIHAPIICLLGRLVNLFAVISTFPAPIGAARAAISGDQDSDTLIVVRTDQQ
jgi:hypothetical protein